METWPALSARYAARYAGASLSSQIFDAGLLLGAFVPVDPDAHDRIVLADQHATDGAWPFDARESSSSHGE